MKKIFIASDHAGYKLKSSISTKLKKIIDLGPKSTDSVDYPDYAKKLSKKVEAKKPIVKKAKSKTPLKKTKKVSKK